MGLCCCLMMLLLYSKSGSNVGKNRGRSNTKNNRFVGGRSRAKGGKIFSNKKTRGTSSDYGATYSSILTNDKLSRSVSLRESKGKGGVFLSRTRTMKSKMFTEFE